MSELKPTGRSFRRLTASDISPAALAEQERKLAYAVERAELMFRCFPRAEADEPETFGAAAAALLARYPDDVIEAVTDPLDGIPARQKWRPHLSEIRDACEQIMIPRRIAAAAEVERERTRRELADTSTPRAQRPTYDELRAKYGPDWGLQGGACEVSKDPQIKTIERANQIMFERECAAAGVDPAAGVSPSLARLLGRGPGTTRLREE